MKVGLCSIARRHDALAEVAAEAAELGFDGLEVWGQPPHLAARTESAGAEAAGIVRAAGLEPAVFGSYLRPGSDSFAAELDGTLAAARGYGAPLMRVWAGGVSDADADEAIWARTVTDFRRLLDACGDLVLTVERHGRTLTESAEGTDRLLEALDDRRLSLNFQYARGCTTTDTINEVRRFWPRISNLHVQNTRDSQPAPVADGELDYGRILTTLAMLGYDGYVEIEFIRAAAGDPADAAERHAALAADYRFLREVCG